jgi:hypothetical protein
MKEEELEDDPLSAAAGPKARGKQRLQASANVTQVSVVEKCSAEHSSKSGANNRDFPSWDSLTAAEFLGKVCVSSRTSDVKELLTFVTESPSIVVTITGSTTYGLVGENPELRPAMCNY